ncbi:HNH endonuclease [Rhodococcus qingshengii]|uniref:HNH endonuclease n=1 Tax=Rhodococcus TaxID=1827 RepID=UPI0009FA30F0|nr:HNH endonuclease [Rhodococcus qingshengii]MCC4303992.1 HNH endonuclease [Rhodococcus sp. 3-2]
MSVHSSRGKEWNKLRQIQLANYNYECVGLFPAVCEVTENLQLDHILAKSKGGEDTLENTRILCRACNSKKGDRDDAKQKAWWSPKYYEQGKSIRRPGT